MIELLPEQLEALRQLQRACQDAGVDAVIIGATAYRVWIDDDRRTQDVDVALAVDVDQFGSLTDSLQAAGWTQDPRREERWLTQAGARIDLLPIGEQARSTGYVTWPKAEMRTSVVGFEHDLCRSGGEGAGARHGDEGRPVACAGAAEDRRLHGRSAWPYQGPRRPGPLDGAV